MPHVLTVGYLSLLTCHAATSSQQSSRGRKRHAATLNSTASKGTSSFNDGEPGTGHGDVGQSNTRFNHQQRATPQEKPARPIRKQTLLISDPAAVKRFFESRINDMQQLAAKKIAKAWIKGICPRKQALFPYQDNNRKKASDAPNVPEWWPSVADCPFREPDHIKKEGKSSTALCIGSTSLLIDDRTYTSPHPHTPLAAHG